MDKVNIKNIPAWKKEKKCKCSLKKNHFIIKKKIRPIKLILTPKIHSASIQLHQCSNISYTKCCCPVPNLIDFHTFATRQIHPSSIQPASK